MFRVLCILFLSPFAGQQFAQVPIGQWRDHLPYNNTIAVTEGSEYYFCASEYALFSYSKVDASVEKLSKANALSDVGISCMRYNNYNSVLVVGYSNGNIDLIKGTLTINLSDIKRNTSIVGDKSINHVYFNDEFAYLSTGFGIVVIDTEREEVADTYSVGPALGDVSVNAIATDANYIYAAANDGLYYANVNSPFLADFNEWSQRIDFVNATVTAGPFSGIVSFGGAIYINYDDAAYDSDTLYYDEGSGWQRFDDVVGFDNNGIEVSNGELVLAHNGNVERYDATRMQTENIFSFNGSGFIQASHAIYSADGFTYIATQDLGLVKAWNSWSAFSIVPPGPYSSKVHSMDSKGDHLWVATGSVSGPWNIDYGGKDGVFIFENEEWSFFNSINEPVSMSIPEVLDFLDVAVDPADPDHVMAGTWTGGVLEFQNGALTTVYDDSNSALQIYDTDVSRVGVAGVGFDADGNAWFSNSVCSEPIVVKEAGGAWYSFGTSAYINGEIVGDILVTQSDHIWVLKPFLGSLGGGIQTFDYNGTLSDNSDDSYLFLNGNIGTGNLPSTTVFCMAEDHDGEIWVGTSEGVAVFYSPDNIFNGGNFDAQQVLLEQDGNLQILLETEEVTAIAIDGANRKWFGTSSSGVFLMSADGTEQVLHFNEDNSPLLSNDISSIAINPETGEVFFGTSEGIISYRGTATEGEELFNNVHAFPNPVREDYTGLIAIKGLMENSAVKITDIAGNLVFETISEGGQAIWNGNDLFGNRVATGVYLVFSANDNGDFTATTKILVIGQE